MLSPDARAYTFVVEVLSRGKGVPEQALEALDQLQIQIEADKARGVAARISRTRIGLEGETRACVEYRDPVAGKAAYARAKALFQKLELVNLRIERCKTDPGR